MATRRRTQKKKKKSNGVWVGSGVSGAVLIVIIIAIWFKMQPGPPDKATGSITEEVLEKQTLPASLPKLAELPSGGSVADLFSAIDANRNFLTAGGFAKEKEAAAPKIIDALKNASGASMPKGLLDNRIPAQRFNSKEVDSDLRAISQAMKIYTKKCYDEGTFDQARQAAFAQVKLGKNMFENNVRLKSRQKGLSVMTSGLRKLGEIEYNAQKDGEIDQEEMKARNEKIMVWNDAVKKINDAWNAKLKTTEAPVKDKPLPNISDIVLIANNDQDPTFRIWAARRLGYALYERGDPGNQVLIKQTIAELKASSDRAVAAAAEDGASIKREDYGDLRS